MNNFIRIFNFLASLHFELNCFRNNKDGITAVEYAVVTAGVVSVMLFVCLGEDSVLANLFTSVFSEVISGILRNINKVISPN